jgi:hypothetical protein
MLSGKRFGPEVFLFYSIVRREYNMKKGWDAACMLGVLLIFAGCEGPVGPEGNPGERGLNVWEGPFSFSIGKGESSGPVTDLTEFSAALKAALEALPEDEGTDPEEPVTLKVNGLTLSETEQLYALYGAISRYVDLDLSGCKGSVVAATIINIYFNTAGSSVNPDICQENKTNIISLILPDSVVALETGTDIRGVFTLFTGLRSVTIPNLRFIGDYAFHSCTALERADFPEVVSIGANAFTGVPLESVNFPKAVSLGQDAFQACGSLETVNLPLLKSMENYAFRGCVLLKSLEFPELNTIGMYAFYKCGGLSSLNVPKLESIGNTAFYDCDNLGELTLGAAPPTVGTTIFSGIDARTINFKVPSASVTDYENWSAANNTALGSTTITRTFTGI